MRHKKLMFVSIFFMAVVMAVSSVALGQENPCPPVDINLAVGEAAQEWWMVLLDALVQLTAPLVGAVLSTLGVIGMRKWFAKMEREGRKVDLETQAAIFQMIDGLVTGGVTFAEEQARKALKVGGPKTEGAEKMQAAVDFVVGNLENSGLPTIGRDELVRLIESRLHQERAAPDGVVEHTPPQD